MATPRAPHEHGRVRRPSPLSECGSAVTLTLALCAGPILADAKNAAELFLATCVAPADNPAGIEAMAKERNWGIKDSNLVFVPLVKRGDPLQRKSAWRGVHNGQEFVIGIGAE